MAPRGNTKYSPSITAIIQFFLTGILQLTGLANNTFNDAPLLPAASIRAIAASTCLFRFLEPIRLTEIG
jgi:hypothetical protein